MGYFKFVLVSALVGSLASVSPLSSWAALADDGRRLVGNSTGGGFDPGVPLSYTPRGKAAAEAKLQLWAAYAAHQAGELSSAKFRAVERQASSRAGFRFNVPITTSVTRSCPVDDPCPSDESILLNVPSHDQNQYYYCGPAAGVMIADYRNAGPSAANGATLTQKHMAGPAHMNTDDPDLLSTPYASNNWTRGLNQWLFGTNGGYYAQVNNPTPSQFCAALGYDLADNHPFGVSTVELATQAHYNGHPTEKTIGHWIVARGFSNYQNTTYFRDPAHGNWPGVSVPQSFNHATDGFVTTFVDNGISA
jgi:hypothetical protein